MLVIWIVLGACYNLMAQTCSQNLATLKAMATNSINYKLANYPKEQPLDKDALTKLLYNMAVNCPNEINEWKKWYAEIQQKAEVAFKRGAKSLDGAEKDASEAPNPTETPNNTPDKIPPKEVIAYKNALSNTGMSEEEINTKKATLKKIVTDKGSEFNIDENEFKTKDSLKSEETIAQDAYHIQSRGRNPFSLITNFIDYSPKFDGILDIEVTIDQTGKLAAASVASKPKDEALNKAVADYIMAKYSKDREWQPALSSKNQFVTSNVNYKEPFYRAIGKDAPPAIPNESLNGPAPNSPKKDNTIKEKGETYYQKFIDFKSKFSNLLTNLLPSQQSTDEQEKNASIDIIEKMDYETKKDLISLIAKPNASMKDVSNYIKKRINSVSKGLKQFLQGKLDEIDQMEQEIEQQ